MKVSVCAKVYYDYEVDIPEDIIKENDNDLAFLCDCEDPVYEKITRVLNEAGLDFDGSLVSICDAETGEELWAE